MNSNWNRTWCAFALVTTAFTASADIKVGVVIPMTGPASSIGASMKNGLSLWPSTIAGEKVEMTILDDATDPTAGVKDLRRLTTEDKVDVVLSSAVTPVAMAMGDVAPETETVQLALSPMPDLPPAKDRWVYRMPHSTTIITGALLKHMQSHGVKTLGFLGYSDTLGESFLAELNAKTPAAGVKMTTVERFQRGDMSVTAQALKLTSANPDAVFIVASGAGAAMPQLALNDRGYKGKIYQIHSAASKDYLRLGGAALNGAFVAAGPALVPELLADDNPSKALGLSFVKRYEAAFGSGTRNTFAAHSFDASLVLEKAVPIALKAGKPGTREFRVALRDAIETMGQVVATQGVYNFSATDHWGFTAASPVVLTVVNAEFSVKP